MISENDVIETEIKARLHSNSESDNISVVFVSDCEGVVKVKNRGIDGKEFARLNEFMWKETFRMADIRGDGKEAFSVRFITGVRDGC